tara:strand:- start:1323 stop:3752 length:2430 start_codon:yes stop_codon:yes gene_type:complete
MRVNLDNFNKYFNHVVTFFLTILIFGIPLAFTSLTRSVFEVNKLYVLRVILLILYFLWFSKYLLFKDNKQDNDPKQSYEILGFRWKRIGLEIPILAWIFLNYVSSYFSENIFVSYIGSYDRWEGISMILNYMCLIYMVAKLVNNSPQRYWIIGMTILSTFFSAFYGILQSLGFDFMNWNADPTKRVFACINNPVHFCAYVAMLVPLGISLAQRMISYKDHVIESIQGIPTYFIRFIILISAVIAAFLFTYKSAFNSFIDGTAVTHFLISISSFFILFFLGLYVLKSYTHLIPSKQTILKCTAFVFLFLILSLFNISLLDRFQFFALICCLSIYFIMNVNNQLKLFYYRATFVISITLYYAMILSYSRATLVGFSIGMAFYFLHYILSEKKPTFKTEFKEVLQQFIGLFLLNIAFIFKLFLHSTFTQILFVIFFLSSHLLFLLISQGKRINLIDYASSILIFSTLSLNFLGIGTLLFPNSIGPYGYFTILISLFILFKVNPYVPKKTLTLIVISFIFMGITFFNFTIVNTLFLLSLVLFLYKKILPNYTHINSEMRFNIVSTLIFMVFITVLPQVSLYISNFIALYSLSLLQFTIHLSFFIVFILIISIFIFNVNILKNQTFVLSLATILFIVSIPMYTNFSFTAKNENLSVANNMKFRMTNLSENATNNARWYMWLSAIPWTLDHPIIGSGPDSIRFLYPRYRHPKYGLAEGGHNFTPDRLHNEYINTLVTRGVVGFIIYYVFVIGGWFYLMLKLFNKYYYQEQRFFILALMTGASIYLVQVLFNFGVVATLYVFYLILGLGLSFVNNE